MKSFQYSIVVFYCSIILEYSIVSDFMLVFILLCFVSFVYLVVVFIIPSSAREYVYDYVGLCL